MEEYKRLKRTLVHQGKITTVYTDTMQLPDGNHADWDFIGHHGAAAFIAENQDGNIVMVRQYRNALERYTLEIPAGGINPGEDFEEAAIRELEEETGYKAGQVEKLIDIYTTVAFCNERIGIYCGKVAERLKQHLDEGEYVDVVELPLEELLEKIWSFEIQDSKTVSALLAYKQRKIKRDGSYL